MNRRSTKCKLLLAVGVLLFREIPGIHLRLAFWFRWIGRLTDSCLINWGRGIAYYISQRLAFRVRDRRSRRQKILGITVNSSTSIRYNTQSTSSSSSHSWQKQNNFQAAQETVCRSSSHTMAPAEIVFFMFELLELTFSNVYWWFPIQQIRQP